jgi:hypothetical protein
MPEDLKNIEFETSEDVEVVPTFDNMGIREDLLRGIYAYGMDRSLESPRICLFIRDEFDARKIICAASAMHTKMHYSAC